MEQQEWFQASDGCREVGPAITASFPRPASDSEFKSMVIKGYERCLTSARFATILYAGSCRTAHPRCMRAARALRLTARAMSTRSVTLPIALGNTEAAFVKHLDDFARHHDPPIECRIAGGWVRDKLLNLPSSDLDIALTTSSGHDFAVSFVEYLKMKGVETGSVGRVAANPDQSKHLETGTSRILGLACDFVGLRSETYSDSRIPDKVTLGTPLEDALRRDLTINALFYNVHSKEVEDHTLHGLDDLRKGIARTPLEPRQTFLDDPLRVLRCIRFASRFRLKIEPDVEQAMRDLDIKSALQTKVSKERVGIEVHKMLTKDPLLAIELIDRLGLHSSIFTTTVDPPRHEAIQAAQILQHLSNIWPVDEYLWFAAVLTPFQTMEVADKKPIPAVSAVISEGLKLSNDIRNNVTNLFGAAKILDPEVTSRSAIGMTLQNALVTPWSRSIVWATVLGILPTWNGSWTGEAQIVLDRFQRFHQRIVDLGLDREIGNPPVLNGKQIQTILNLKPSPLLKVLRDAVLVWQFDHPGGTKEECEQYLRVAWDGEDRQQWEDKARVQIQPPGEKRKR